MFACLRDMRMQNNFGETRLSPCGRITSPAVNRAIGYILRHAGGAMSVEEVAAYCHFSKYYFCRLFKAQTGESLYSFIKRLRIEQSAFRLKTEAGRSITEIGADLGYSSSNYSEAFKKHFKTAPAMYRRGRFWRTANHPVFTDMGWHAPGISECMERIAVEEVPDIPVVYERYFGCYEEISKAWDFLFRKYEAWITPDTRFLEVTYDDPTVTFSRKCLYDICFSVPEGCGIRNNGIVHGGRCAVYHFKGHVSGVFGAYQSIFLLWLPKTGHRPDMEKPPFDIYRSVDRGTMDVEMDICVPLAR